MWGPSFKENCKMNITCEPWFGFRNF